jgi:polyferredoxin
MHKIFTTRVFGYSIVLVALMSLLTALLLTRSPIESTILRTPGTLYTVLENGNINNLYSIRIINKTFDEIPVEIRLKGTEGKLTLAGPKLIVLPDNIAQTVLITEINPQYLNPGKNTIIFEIVSNGEVLETVSTGFMAPENLDGR